MERPDSIERRESKEKLNENLRKFIYQDNHDNRKIIFECLAENINEADKIKDFRKISSQSFPTFH